MGNLLPHRRPDSMNTLCQLEAIDGGAKCKICDTEYVSATTDAYAVCRGRGKGLGDSLTRYLKSAGITENRYQEIKKAFGMPPGCNCAKRREWLNKVGRYLGV